jgi:lipoyl(octanoyl) transferase
LQLSEAKIAALGVRVQKWVTSHGIAVNVNPDLSHYAGIVPCGIREFGVTSIHQLGLNVSMEEVDAVLQQKFSQVFVS